MKIYVLKLKHSKYYVGKSDNVNNRIDKHKSNKGAIWTKKYKVIDVVEIKESNSIFDEMNTTLNYMDKYGIDNVRGGPWCDIHIDDTEKEYINKNICSIYDKCYICHSTKHISKKCPKNLKWECEICGKKYKSYKVALNHENKCKIIT